MGKIKTLDTDRCNGCNNRQSDCMCPIEAAQLGERASLTATQVNRREDERLAFYSDEPLEWDMFG